MKSKQGSGEVSDEELETVAGGGTSSVVAFSICSAGVVCGIAAALSERKSSAGNCLESLE